MKIILQFKTKFMYMRQIHQQLSIDIYLYH